MASASHIINIPFQEQERRLLSQLSTMREQGQLCDMTVRVGTREFRCHQAVLAASSGHFHSVFVQGALSFPKMLDLTFTSADVFSVVLDYIYTASLKCPTDVLPQVLQAAKVLEIHTLVDHLLLFSASQEGGRDGETAPSSCTDLPVPSGVNTPVSSPGPGVRDNVVVKQEEQEHNQEETRPQTSRLEENSVSMETQSSRLEEGSMGTQIAELRAEVAFLRQQLQSAIGEEAVSPRPAKRPRIKAKSSLLSGTVRRLHNADTNHRKYRGDLGLNAPYNEGVTTLLMKEVSASSEYHPQSKIRAACVAYYETVRRKFLESQPENTDKARKQKNEKRLRSRRKRLLECRGGVLQSEEERRLWTGVTPDLMSDKEDGESNGMPVWLVRPPSFRTDELSNLCVALQARLEADRRYRVGHTPRKMEPGTFSERLPPRVYDPERAAQHIRPESDPNKLGFMEDMFTSLDV
ncbi:uncharacterized protein [Branchiostoma lanceolatum]|uniref:uncharacterized protein n=1 Tax=Branchiostoma lanceolatum TaxID=7740 RepID=UPI003453A3F4